MGVLGLAPFLQKTVPQVIKKLPDRLRDLGGKTIVIDGTLITQRLHYAPAPHPYRHVLGWYRLAQELKENDVRSICVFDGKERIQAKSEEVERRRQIRRLDSVRGEIETSRLQRLSSLVELLHTCRHLDVNERLHATRALRSLVLNGIAVPVEPLYVAGEISGFETPAHKQAVSSLITLPCETEDDLTISDEELREILHENAGTQDDSELPSQVSVSDVYLPPQPHGSGVFPRESEDMDFDQLSLDSFNFARQLTDDERLLSRPEPSQTFPMAITVQNLPYSLSNLYLDFRQSVSALHVLPPTPLPDIIPPAAVPIIPPLAIEQQTEAAMSKSQYQLMLEEERFWKNFAESSVADEACHALEISLATMANKSTFLVQSYFRRSHPPTEDTYLESKMILEAMGVPIVESTGRFEAEGLASSLVLHGYADYVATEDTDVLAYGAPMLRNITSRREPLVAISGADVRAALGLSAPAYLDFLLLLGTDFTQRIRNVGPQRALRFVREHGSIERILAAETQFPARVPPDVYLAQVRAARAVFETLPPVPSPPVLQAREYDEQKVADVMQRYGLHRHLGESWDYAAALDGNYFQDSPHL